MKRDLHPEIIQIETTIACNATCPFCPQHEVTRRPGVMKEEIWKKIIDETRNLGIIYRPFLINEPLTDKRLGSIMRYIRTDSSATIELNTNGALMTDDMARAILDAGIDVIRFSIDGFSKETYAAARPGLDYAAVVERTVRFIRLAERTGGAGRIEVRMIGMESNRHEQERFKEFWARQGATPLITTLYKWPWEPGVVPVQLPCIKILKEMFFYVDGRATLCCWDTHERAVIGDVATTHTLDIWNGETNRRYRALLERGERSEILLCSRCEAYKDYPFERVPGSDHQG
jgi:hypothetical protein